MTRLARSAPAVQYPLHRSGALAVVLGCLLCAGASLLVAWLVQGPPAYGWLWMAAAGLWLVTVACAAHFWWHQFSGKILWDGEVWMLEEERYAGAFLPLGVPPAVHLDLQDHLWVCTSPAARPPVWLWIERSYQPERWMDLRRAVYSRAKPGAPSTDATASAAATGRDP